MKGYTIIQSIIYASMIVVLITIAIIDAKQKVINQRLLYVLVIGSIVAIYINRDLYILDAISASILTFVILSVIHYISHRALGFGDVKLCSCVAMYLGMQKTFSMFFSAIIICGLAALMLLCASKSNRKRELPFAPFVAIGTIVALTF
jgi:prepilin signal peptidase PulO-like enzyme (type II secretory pathway)